MLKIKDYWESPDTVSIIDNNLHRLEIEAVSKHLCAGDRIVDIGCGDGLATIDYAKKVKSCIAIERSNYLRGVACNNIVTEKQCNIDLKEGDILSFKSSFFYDKIITQRCLINLQNWDEQKVAIQNIYNSLRYGGLYLMVENTTGSFVSLNNMRHKVGIEPIKQHWHNTFFDEDLLNDFMKDKFSLVKVYDFGLYYFLTRVYMQMFATFEGFGKTAVRDDIFAVADNAARIAYNQFRNIEIRNSPSITKVFVWQKK